VFFVLSLPELLFQDSYLYTELSAEVVLTAPNGTETRRLPLFWDGGSTWKFRFSPDRIGTWGWIVASWDKGLNGRTGAFRAVNSKRKGSLRPMPDLSQPSRFPGERERLQPRPVGGELKSRSRLTFTGSFTGGPVKPHLLDLNAFGLSASRAEGTFQSAM